MSQCYDGCCKLREILVRDGAHFHFAGILGVSMSSLAELLLMRGCRVSGSDTGGGEVRARLSKLGVKISEGNKSEYMDGADALIYSFAISQDAQEMCYAREYSIPAFSRAELLGALMLPYQHRIGISGTHGKSTTTAMIHKIFTDCGYAPTTLSGAAIEGERAHSIGGREYLIYEACEYRDAFLSFSPECAVITGIELDHTDYYKNTEMLLSSFEKSVEGATRVILNCDFPASASLSSRIRGQVITYGRGDGVKYKYSVQRKDADGTVFSVASRAEVFDFYIPIMGEHNVANATAAIAVSLEYGLQYSDICASLADFCGVSRRLEYLFSVHGRPVIYDYAHHPTEINAAISAVKEHYGECTVVFRPHTYTRTRDLWCELVRALSLADYPVIADIYAAREEPIGGVSAQRLASDIGQNSAYVMMDSIADHVIANTRGPIILMGAGDLENVKKSLKSRSDI